MYDIDIQDNKKYIYVMSYYSPSNDLMITHLMNTDISIFEINEWNDLLNKSEIFKKYVNILNRESDIEYINARPEIKNAIYYLYHNCVYCKYEDFTSLEYCIGNKQDIYERVFLETKNKDRYNISINNFREWIIDNYENFNKNYNIIKLYDDESVLI
jgi:hypothetical protein